MSILLSVQWAQSSTLTNQIMNSAFGVSVRPRNEVRSRVKRAMCNYCTFLGYQSHIQNFTISLQICNRCCTCSFVTHNTPRLVFSMDCIANERSKNQTIWPPPTPWFWVLRNRTDFVLEEPRLLEQNPFCPVIYKTHQPSSPVTVNSNSNSSLSFL